MPEIEHRGQRIHFEDTGSGPCVVLGHSFLCSTEMWREQVPGLAKDHRVVNIDYRGHGKSSAATEPFTLYDLLDDSLAILDHLAIESAIWAGLSTGGMVALRAALREPNRVRGLILLDTHAGPERPFVRLKYRAMVTGARLVGVRPVIPFVLPLMFGRSTLAGNRALVEEWTSKLADPEVGSLARWVEALVRRDSLLEQLGSIDTPALVVVGAEDRALPPALSQQLDARLSDSILEIVQEAGHLTALEQPEAVTKGMLGFLDRLKKGV